MTGGSPERSVQRYVGALPPGIFTGAQPAGSLDSGAGCRVQAREAASSVPLAQRSFVLIRIRKTASTGWTGNDEQDEHEESYGKCLCPLLFLLAEQPLLFILSRQFGLAASGV